MSAGDARPVQLRSHRLPQTAPRERAPGSIPQQEGRGKLTKLVGVGQVYSQTLPLAAQNPLRPTPSPNSRLLVPIFRINRKRWVSFCPDGVSFAQNTTLIPCSLLSRHTPFRG